MRFAQKRLASRGVEVIDLDHLPIEMILPEGISPDAMVSESSPAHSLDYLSERLRKNILEKHRSLSSVAIDPEREICLTPGNRIAASFLTLGLLNPGEVVSYPDPGAQYFRTAICLAEGNPKKYALLEGNDYIVNISGLPSAQQKKTKVLFIEYPHDPTGATVDYYFYRELFKSLRFSNTLLVADCAHIHPGNPDPTGPLQVKFAGRRAIELHTFATTFGITGLGFAVGHKDVIAVLKGLMSAHGLAPDERHIRLASGCLEQADKVFTLRMENLRRRREILADGLKKLGWHTRSGRLVPFIWARPPVKSTSLAFARRLFIKAGIRVTPGSDFGENGEGWIRLALAGDERVMTETVERLAQHSRIWQRKFRPE
jgi:aspartate/methionine/tyrosine aminotransferase